MFFLLLLLEEEELTAVKVMLEEPKGTFSDATLLFVVIVDDA